jgi:succinate-semialdehyde dehydrogenase/glutarate-semialdehyde dehydrogenase
MSLLLVVALAKGFTIAGEPRLDQEHSWCPEHGLLRCRVNKSRKINLGAIGMLELSESGLLRQQCYVNGQWLEAAGGDVIEVRNPASGELLGKVPALAETEVVQAIEAADSAFPVWREQTADERAALLLEWHHLILQHQEDLARLMTAEQGKPLAEARGEVAYGASFVKWFAEEARRVYGDLIPSQLPDRRLLVIKQPIGVVAAITPWNFPSAMLTRKLAPALAAGCTVVAKPASQTPFSALALCVLAERAGIPPGVINLVTGKATTVGGVLTAHPVVRKLSFTGSTRVGKLLMQQCAQSLKRVSLELGGNAPFIVFDDADLDAAVKGVLASKYRNSGQTCVCANRILVQDGIHDEFAARLAASVASLEVGDGNREGVTQGPLIDERAVEKVEGLVADALACGARVLSGGRRHALGGTFYEPTILTDVSAEMRIANEEIFGPVAPLYRFHDEAEAISMANDTPYGLAAYFYSRDIGRCWRVAERLEYGMVGINEGIISTAVAPFGGVKESGIGREGSRYGIEEYLEMKYLCMGGL